MREFKGTQGNWNFSLNKDARVISIHTGETSDEIEAGKGIWNDPNICGLWYDDLDISMANAQLISASPDLLNACQQLMDCYDTKGQLLSFDVNVVREAVNKALGL